MKHTFKILAGIAFLAVAILSLFGIGLPALIGTGVTLAVAGSGSTSTAVVDTAVTAAKSSQLLMNDVDQNITKIYPSKTPVDTVLRHINNTKKVSSWTSEYYKVDTRGIKDTTNGAVASTTGKTEGQTFSVVVDNVNYWAENDNIWFQSVNGKTATGEFCAHVKSIDTDTSTLTCIAINGPGASLYNNPLIPDETTIVRIGSSYSEKDAQASKYSIFPEKSSNYLQRFMAQVEESIYDKLHSKEVKWDFTDYRMQALYDFRRQNELATLFGTKGKVYDSTRTEYIYSMDGITKSVTNTMSVAATALATDDFYTWAMNIFSGNGGSDTRIMFAGPSFLRYMSALEPVQKQLDANSSLVKYGVKFNSIETIFGTLLVKLHDDFGNIGWTNKALVIDPAHVERHVWMPLAERKLDLVKAGTRYTDAVVMEETYTIAVRYPQTHALVTLT